MTSEPLTNHAVAVRSQTKRWLGLASGPLLGAMLWLAPLELEAPAHRLSAILVWTMAWWLTEALPLPVTAVGSALALVLFGVTDARAAFQPFADPVIFLFLGGFMLARALELHGTDRRLTISLLSFPGIRGRPRRSLVALLCATSVLSMWVSNTATTVIMLPVALGILDRLIPQRRELHGFFVLSIAYAANIGGVATPVGSPPNAVAVGLLQRMAGIEVSFLEWMSWGVPFTLGLTALLAALVHRRLGRQLPERWEGDPIAADRAALGPWTSGQLSGLFAAGVAVFLWIVPDLVSNFTPELEFFVWLKKRLPESAVALLAAGLLFLLPGKPGRPALPWNEAVQIDWGTLLLFGGGLSLGTQIASTGLSEALARWMPIHAAGAGAALSVVVMFAIAIAVTELMSNTAAANLILPLVLATVAQQEGDPTPLTVTVAIACGLGFMMPVGTPPNALVYGTGRVPFRMMMAYGAVFNLAAIAIAALLIRLR